MIKAGIIGATGYAGGELVRLLLGHKEVEIVWYGSRSYVDEKYAHVYRNMFDIVDATCLDDNLQGTCKSGGGDLYGNTAGLSGIHIDRGDPESG